MFHRENHAADRGIVGLHHGGADLLQAQRLHRADLVFMPADGALHERDFQLHFETPSLAQQLFDGLAAKRRHLLCGAPLMGEHRFQIVQRNIRFTLDSYIPTLPIRTVQEAVRMHTSMQRTLTIWILLR